MSSTFQRLFKVVALLGIFGVASQALSGRAAAGEVRDFCVDYRQNPDAQELLAFDLAVLSPNVTVDLAARKAQGRRTVAYLSLVEVGGDVAWRDELKEKGIDLLGTNPAWKSQIADIANPAWAEFVVERLAKPAVERGFDGLFLDTADSLARFSQLRPDQAAAGRTALLGLIRRLHEQFPGRELILNRGFDLIDEVPGCIQGVLIESVFRTADHAAGTFGPVREADSSVLVARITALRKNGMPVYVIDYVPPADAELAAATVKRIRDTGAVPFLSTPELQGEYLGPVRREKRRLLVLFGSVQRESEEGEKFEFDTFTAERLQMPLEWMGYEVDYLNIGRQSPPPRLDHRYAGVIFDAEVALPYAGEPWYVDWVLDHTRHGLKVLFAGQYPFQQDVEKSRLFQGLGLVGTFQQVKQPDELKITTINPKIMNAEAKVTPQPGEVMDLRAPAGAEVDLRVECVDDRANRIQFDTVYSCPWGGALLDPYVTFQSSADDILSLFEPFGFLQKIWPAGAFPAPDPSTRDGRRVFYSHVDGDGFAGGTYFNGQALCGEVLRDRILKVYPFPITCSIVEANIRALELEQDVADAPRYEAAARSMFALPNVQAATHSFTHPYVWIDNDDEYLPLYESRALELNPKYAVKGVDPVREIEGSIKYMEERLLPPGRKVDLMLWSGNCRPGAKALDVCDRLGIENLNGGNTTICRKHPSISNVAPRTMSWDGRLQIHASNQNEFVYTNNWTGPYFGGFSQVIDTFKRTESPRRLKPVNIYYHFYSAAYLGSLRALQQVHDWCLKEPLHSMTTSEFARITRDSWSTRVLRTGERSWRLVNGGKLRTFRLPKGAGVPDVGASSGVTGWVETGGQMFVHTSGRPVTDLVLVEEPQLHLYLQDSMGEITFEKLDAYQARFRVSDLRPSYTVAFAGVKPGTAWTLVVNGRESTLTADAAGRLVLTLGGENQITLTQQQG